MDSGTKMPGFEFWVYHLVTLKRSANYCVCLSVSIWERHWETGPTLNVGYYQSAHTTDKKMTKTSPCSYNSSRYYIYGYMFHSPHQEAEGQSWDSLPLSQKLVDIFLQLGSGLRNSTKSLKITMNRCFEFPTATQKLRLETKHVGLLFDPQHKKEGMWGTSLRPRGWKKRTMISSIHTPP